TLIICGNGSQIARRIRRQWSAASDRTPAPERCGELSAAPDLQQARAIAPRDAENLTRAIDDGAARRALPVIHPQFAKRQLTARAPRHKLPPETLSQRAEFGQQFLQSSAPDQKVRTARVVQTGTE